MNHLFALECNSPGFIPSSPYIGADGAWDGFFDGYYAQEGLAGIWSIQSKWTTKSFKAARFWLKREIEKELNNAIRNKVEHLRIATNAELQVDQIRELENLNNGKVFTLKIWHREELSRRIELQPYLMHLFFGVPQYPKFAPAEIYFQVERHLLPVQSTKMPKFRDYLDRISQFVALGAVNLFLIHSPGGYGKSHLLRDIQEIAYKADPERQTWMIRQGYRGMQDAVQEELVDGRKYLLILDDADRYIEEVKPLFSFAKHKGHSVKVVLAMRTSGLQIVYETIRQLRCEEIYEEMTINTWAKDELVELLRMASGQEKVEDEEIIAALYPNPYLIVWIGRRIKKEPTIDFKKVKEKFINDVDYEAERCLEDVLSVSDIKEFLTHLACIVPFSEKDPKATEILDKVFAISGEVIKEKLNILSQAGILRVVGGSLRFDPDMKGDLYLSYRIEKFDPSRLRNLVLTWLPDYAEKLFVNFGGASRYGETSILEKIFSEILDSWTKEAASTPGVIREERLKLTGHIANIVPKNSVNLLYAYLHSVPPPSEDPFLKALKVNQTDLTSDDYGPVILRLLRMPDIRSDIVEIIREINEKSIERFYDNYKPLSLIRSAVSPLDNSPRVILTTLDILSKWLEEPTEFRMSLISSAIAEVLAGTHSFTKSTIGGIVFGENMLRPTKEILEIRNKALDILKTMIKSESSGVRLAGIKLAEKIGESRGGVGPRSTLPLSGRIAAEREEIIDEIGKHINNDAGFLLLSEIEDLFIRWWAMEMPGTDKVEDYLERFPREAEYIVYRYFASPEYIVRNFTSLKRDAAGKDRWVWFVHNVMHNKNQQKLEYFEPEAKSLNEKYDSKEKAVRYLVDLYAEISNYNNWPRPQIVSCWVILNPKLFRSLRDDEKLWGKIPERFQNEIDLALAQLDEGIVKRLAEEVLSGLPNTSLIKTQTLLTMLGRQHVEEETLATWLSQIVEEGSPGHRALVISYLDLIFEKCKNVNLILHLSRTAISKEGELTVRDVDNLSFLVHRLKSHIVSADEALLKKFVEGVLDKLKDSRSLEWHSQELLEFIFSGVDSVIGFVEYRLQKSKDIREKGGERKEFEAIPFDGLWCIKNQIHSLDDYEKLIENVIEWQKEDTPYREIDLIYLMKPIRDMRDPETNRLFIEEYIEKQIERKKTGKALIATEYLPFNESTIALLVKVGEAAMAEGSVRGIERLLWKRCYPEAGWSGKLGEPPLALEELKTTFTKMHAITKPGELRITLEKCIKSIQEEIKDKLRRDEEILNPRG